ncbi:MAG: cytochrome c [Gammaproteobacteria bacterium]|nr:cytochrome c [Gammaproteobacteria bacterium]
MSRRSTLLIAPLLLGLQSAVADGAGVDTSGPGWTGLEHPAEIVAARQALMVVIEEHMQAIDTFTVDPDQDPEDVNADALTIAALMQSLPHLFPPTTNLYDAADSEPATLALPRIWQEFQTFYTMAQAATSTAMMLAETVDHAAMRQGSLNLRASCDACHALYLLPYKRGGVTQEDLDFDFDSVFPEK